MKPTINTTLQTLPQLQLSNSSINRFNLASPKVIEAIVLSSSPLLSSTTKGQSGQQFLIKLQPSAGNNLQTLDVVADKAVAKGSQLTIQIGREQAVQIINIKPPQLSPPANTNPSIKEQAAVDNLLRQALPIKQATVKLLPLLQLLSSSAAPSGEALPKPLTQAISRLLSAFPDPESLQTPSGVKKAISNNGTFLESKIAELIKLAGNNSGVIKEAPLRQLINQDIKGQLQQLIKLVDQLSAKNAEAVQQQPAKSLITGLPRELGGSAKTPLPTQPLLTTSVRSGEGVASLKPPELTPSLLATSAQTKEDGASAAQSSLAASTLPLLNQPLIASHNSTGPRVNENLDLVLKQLSRQLMSSLSQTQVYQAETLSNRVQPQPDGQQTINNWALELPVFNGKQFDNIDLRIRRDGEDSEQSNKAAQWTIMLSFDLHSLGKVKVQLSVVEQSVSATVWSESEKTHLTVKQHIATLQKNFEQVGVHVKRLECLLGQPPEPKNEISQQLVDTHS